MMRARIKQGRLVLTRGERVSQYRLPSRMHFLYGCIALVMLFLVANPVVMSLLGQALAERNVGKLKDAADVSIQKVTSKLKNVVCVSRPPVSSQLPTYHLHLPNNTLQKMQLALVSGAVELNHDPGGNKPYFKAVLQNEGRAQRVKVCLRGTMHWHHRGSKPSFRIKINKDDIERGDRYIELTTPEDSLVLNNWLPMQLAGELGLMNDASRHVRLFINNKYFGVYVHSTRPGEPFALANQRMPGTFFKAEFSEKMWESADAWKTFGQQDPQDIAVLQSWLDLLQAEPTAGNIERFSSIFDTEKFARWAALMTVVGSIHTDDQHNHSYFFCSNQGQLEPMPWDCNGYGLHTQTDSPVDVQVQPALRFMSSDPRWVHRRNQWIQKLINEAGSTERVTCTIEDCLSSMRSDMNADRNLGDLKKFTGTGWNWMPVSVADTESMKRQLLQWVKGRNEYLQQYLNYAKFTVQPNSAAGENKSSLIKVFGTVAIEVTNTATGESRTLYPGISKKRWIHTSKQQQADIQFLYLRPASQTYRIDASPEQLVFRNAITSKSISAVNPEEESSDAVLATLERESRTVPIDEFAKEPTGLIELGPGLVELNEDLLVRPDQTLKVHPGTQIKLAAGAGIYSRGQTRFLGTEQDPISITRLDAQPWAAIGIAGPRTSGSIFEYVEVQGGSIGKLDELRFKGMLNAYDCPQITLRHCQIGANLIGDDAVNLAESNIRVQHCYWRKSKADALDLDMCTGTVSNCRWEDSGNDGLDLMGCNVTIRDCVVSGSGDKGISVGENTRLKAHNVTIRDCLIGTEIKDDSVAQFNGCWFDNCQTAVHSYQKKWFYSAGGTCALVDCRITNSQQRDIDMQAKCNAILVRTNIDSPGSSKRVQQADSIPDDWKTLIEPLPFPLKRGAE